MNSKLNYDETFTIKDIEHMELSNLQKLDIKLNVFKKKLYSRGECFCTLKFKKII